MEPPYIRLPRWYLLGAGVISLLASGTVRGAMSIDAIADFEVVYVVATRTGTFTSELTDQSGRAWQSAPVDDENMWGTAQLPLAFPAPLIMKAKSLLNWVFRDTSAAPNDIQPCFIGYDLYPA